MSLNQGVQGSSPWRCTWKYWLWGLRTLGLVLFFWAFRVGYLWNLTYRIHSYFKVMNKREQIDFGIKSFRKSIWLGCPWRMAFFRVLVKLTVAIIIFVANSVRQMTVTCFVSIAEIVIIWIIALKSCVCAGWWRYIGIQERQRSAPMMVDLVVLLCYTSRRHNSTNGDLSER